MARPSSSRCGYRPIRRQSGHGGVALDGRHVADVDSERIGGQLHHSGLDAVAG